MTIITYTMTLDEPLLATSLQGEPNSSVSLNYIPGSLLRGALIARYLQDKPSGFDPTHDDEARRLFFAGSTRYLHAYPLVNQQRALPTPRCLATGKRVPLEAGQPIKNLADSELQDPKQRKAYEDANGDLKPIRKPFCTIDGNTIILHSPERTLAIHVQRDRRKGRANREEGAVFRYDALAAAQQFCGAILVDTGATDSTDAELLRNMFPQDQSLWLGRSRSAHYGRVHFSNIQLTETWAEYDDLLDQLPAQQNDTNLPYILFFLSDAIIPNEWGQPVTSLTGATLAQALGIPAGTLTIVREQSFVGTTMHGGYHAAAKIQLVQQSAIVAGSVVTFRLNQPLNAVAVQRLHQQGIGLRRSEGFGRIALRRQFDNQFMLSGADQDRSDFDYDCLDPHEQAIAATLAARLASQRRTAVILEYLRDVELEQLPNPSQLNELRTIIRSMRASNNATDALQQVAQHIGTMRQTARRQFERARIQKTGGDSTALLMWIQNLIKKPQEQLEKELNLSQTEARVARQSAPPTDHQQFAMDLLAAVLEKAARQKVEDEQ